MTNGNVQGQPQCRRNVIIVDFPSWTGKESSGVEGALLPISGTGDVVTDFGKAQLLSSCWKVIMESGIQLKSSERL